MAANNSYQEAVALIAAANRVVQDPNSVGAALRTISLRLRGTSTKELEEAGEDTTGVVESKSKLRTKIQGYTGIDILTDSGVYKSTYDILLEISKVWKDLTDQDRAGLLEIIAGKTRSNTAAAILSNTKDLEEAYASAMDAEGSALRENEVYLDSIQGRIDLFNNAIQTMWNTEMDSGVIKFFVDLGTTLVKVVDSLGLINTLVFGIMTYLTVFKKNKLDFASMLGIHDVENGWTFGKEGFTGWIHKKFGKNTAETDIGQTFQELTGETLSFFDEDQQTQAQLNEKLQQLNQAKADLTKLNRKKFKDVQIPDDALEYKTGNRRMTYVNEVLIPNKEEEIKALEKDITDITNAGKEKLKQSQRYLIEDADGYLMMDIDSLLPSKTSSKYLDIFNNGLQGGTEKLVIDNVKQLGVELDKLNNMDNNGIINYMSSLDDLGDVSDETKRILAGYASTVKDGNYTVQGARQYVDQYNKSLKQMSKEAAKAQLMQNLLNLALSAIAMGISAIITWAINQISKIQDEFDKLSSELASTTSELNNLESELDGINEQIKELQEQGTLSFTDQEELDRLKAESEELERQIDLKETLQKQQQKEMNSTALKAANSYYKNTGVKSGKTTGEIAGEWAGWGAGLGAAGAGMALMAGVLTGGIGLLIAAGITAGSALIGAAVGGVVGSAEEKVGNSLDNMQERYTELQQKYADAQGKYETTLKDKDYEKAQKAQDQLVEYEANMAKYLTEMDAYYSQMDWETATTEQRKAMQEFYDTQDKWLIQSGGENAKSNAIDRIFGDNADKGFAQARAKIKSLKEELKLAQEYGDADQIADAYARLDEFELNMLSDEEIQRLRDMGIYLYEAEDALKDVVKAETELEDFSLLGVAKDIKNVAGGLESLKSAFEEVTENGFVSANTLVELEAEFGDLEDSWTNYVNTMFSGVASTKEMTDATSELAQAWMDSKLDDLTEETRITYIIQLKNLGVENAEEYVDDKLEEKKYTEIFNSATAFYDQHQGWSDDYKQQLADTYGLELDMIDELLGKVEEYDRKKGELEGLQGDKEEYDGFASSFSQASEDIDALEKQLNGFNPDDWTRSADENGVQYYSDSGILTYDEYTKLNTLYENLQTKKQELDKLINEGLQKGWVTQNKDGTYSLAEGVSAEFEAAITEAENGMNELKEEITTGYTADIKLKVEVYKASQAVDDIQSIYDTLSNAAKEYSENGGEVSVDTFQELLQLEPKYLAMLYNEQGQLILNKDALYQVAQARLYDLTQKQIDSIITNATNAAKAGEIDKLKELTEVLYNAAQAQGEFNTQGLAGLRIALANEKLGLSETEQNSMFNSVKSQVDAVIGAYKVSAGSINTLKNTLSSSGNTAKADAEDAFQKAMDYWENRIGANKARYEQIQNEIDLLEKKGKIAGKEYYEEQIKLENERLKLLELQKAEAKNFLGTFKEGSDEWFRKKPVYWETNKCNPLNCWNSLRVLYTTTQG